MGPQRQFGPLPTTPKVRETMFARWSIETFFVTPFHYFPWFLIEACVPLPESAIVRVHVCSVSPSLARQIVMPEQTVLKPPPGGPGPPPDAVRHEEKGCFKCDYMPAKNCDHGCEGILESFLPSFEERLVLLAFGHFVFDVFVPAGCFDSALVAHFPDSF